MKIKYHFLEEESAISINEFADKHGFVMEVHERPKEFWPNRRFYACFPAIGIVNGFILSSAFGEGSSPEEAIQSYIERISGKRVCIRGSRSLDIQVPILKR